MFPFALLIHDGFSVRPDAFAPILSLPPPVSTPGIDFLPPDKAWPGIPGQVSLRRKVSSVFVRGRREGTKELVSCLATYQEQNSNPVAGNLAGHSVPKSSLVIPWINNQGSPALLIKSSSFWFSIYSALLSLSFLSPSPSVFYRPLAHEARSWVWLSCVIWVHQSWLSREGCGWTRLQPEPSHRLSSKGEANQPMDRN